MATLTSILGSDLISASRSTINDNFNNLNTAKAETASPTFTGTPTAPTAAQATNNTQIATTAYVTSKTSSVFAAITSSMLQSYIPGNPGAGAPSDGTMTVNSSVTSFARMFTIPAPIEVNSVSIRVTSVGVAGSMRLGIYSANGQTQKTSMIFSSVTSTGVKTANVTSVLLAAGNYYSVYNAIDGQLTVSVTTPGETQLGGSVAGMRYAVNTSVVGGALPASIDPVSLPVAPSNLINMRLDS